MRIVLILHLIFWIFFAITVALNNRSLKDMKDNKYYFLIKINKIILLSLVCITILISVYWTIIYKNFEFYCEAFQRQLKDNSDAMNANIEQSVNISNNNQTGTPNENDSNFVEYGWRNIKIKNVLIFFQIMRQNLNFNKSTC